MGTSVSQSSGYLKSYESINNQQLDEEYSLESSQPELDEASYSEEVYQDSFVGNEGFFVEGGVSISTAEAETKIEELFAILRQSDLVGVDRQRITSELQNLKTQLNDLGDNSLPPSFDTELTAIEAEILGRAPQGEEAGPNPKESIQIQIDSLLETLAKSKNITKKRAQALETKINRLKVNLDLNATPEQMDDIRSQLTAFEQEITSYEASSDSANRIASEFNLNPIEVTALAEAAGLDLDNLPEKPNDRVMSFLRETGYLSSSHMESFKSTLESRKEKIRLIEDKVAANEKAMADYENGTSNVYVELDTDSLGKLTEYASKGDGDFRRMKKDIDVLMEEVKKGLEDLGYEVVSGRSGPFAIVINGENYFLDPATGNLSNKEPALMP